MCVIGRKCQVNSSQLNRKCAQDIKIGGPTSMEEINAVDYRKGKRVDSYRSISIKGK